MTYGERTANYEDANSKVHVRGFPLPCRDAVEDEWPFTDSTKDLGGRHQTYLVVKSEDDPTCYFPIRHPKSGQYIQSVDGSYKFQRLLIAYNKDLEQLVVLGGYDWSVDFDCEMDTKKNICRPKGTGLLRFKLPDVPGRFHFDISTRVPWQGRWITATENVLFDRLQESFDGHIWQSHYDHFDRLDANASTAVSWALTTSGFGQNRSGRTGFSAKKSGGWWGRKPESNDNMD